MIKIAICDDMEEISLGMKKALQLHNFEQDIEVDSFVDGTELVECALRKRYDIIFLDIELSEDGSAADGMEISNKIKDAYPEVLVIFFTGISGYERKLLNFEPFRFIKKPVHGDEMISVVDAAIKRLKGWEDKYFTFKTSGITSRVNIKEIVLFTSRRPYIIIQCINDEIDFRGKMDDIELEIEKITDDFIRINKSYLVNKKFIKSYSSRSVIMMDGEKITISRKYIKNLEVKMKN